LIQDRGIRFKIGCDTSGPDSAAIDGGFHERQTIEIFVSQDDAGSARDLIVAWRSAVGKITQPETSNHAPQPTPNDGRG